MAADDSNSVSDTALNVQNTNLSSAVPTESSQNYTITPDPIISGTVTQCGSTDPFPGVNVTVCDVNGNILASTITDQNGFYTVAFLSDQTTFKVIAHLVGHIPDSKDVTVSPNPNDPSDPNLYATADLELGPFAIFLNHGSSNMNTIDAVSDSEYGPFASLAQSHPVDVAITPDGKTAVIACWGHITYFVDITDPTNPSVIGSVSNPNINSAYVSLTPDGKYALVTGLGPPGVIYVIEVATRTLVYTYIDPTTNLFGVGVAPDGQTVIATKYDTNQVNILTIDPSSGLLTSLYTLSTGLGPSSVAISPDGRTALVTNQNGASVSVFYGLMV